MNANGSDFLLLAGPTDFRTEESDVFHWDKRTAVLRMAEHDQPRIAQVPREGAHAVWRAAMPLCEDRFGQLGLLNGDRTALHYALRWPIDDTDPVRVTAETRSGVDTEATIFDPVTVPEGAQFTDLHLGQTHRAALTYSDGDGQHGVTVVDLARRWQDRVALPSAAVRVWVDPMERLWAAGDGHLWLIEGGPLPQPYRPKPDRFEPVDIEPDPLRLLWQRPLVPGWRLLAIAADAGYLYLLIWQEAAGDPGHRQVILRRQLVEEAEAPLDFFELPTTTPFAIDLRPVAPDQLALMIPAEPADVAFRQCDLPIVNLEIASDGTRLVRSVPRRYPQPSQETARFVAAADGTVKIRTTDGVRGLWSLPQVRYPATAEAVLTPPLDSGTPGTSWHMVCLDACIPVGTTLSLDARAFDGETPEGRWHGQPSPVWSPLASELPFHGGHFAPKAGREGLFQILLQRDDGPVRQMNGRRLQLRLRLSGDGRHSPALAAMRVYLPRASWQESYLPAHFRQQAPVQEIAAFANGADLRERVLASFEAMITPIEDRIGLAEAWLSPKAAPERHLSRLAGLIGGELPAHWPVSRKRCWIACLSEIQRSKGTLKGLCLALDVATDGAVARGQIVPVENYRLRRTMATILGLDLDDRDHPLTLGSGQSGNSIIGPSLILSDETARDFVALFAPELADRAGDAEAVEAFFDRYAHRLSVVVHGLARALRASIEATLTEHIPAGVQWTIIETDRPFVLGLSPLLGIDSLLETSPAWRAVVLEDTTLGREGILQSPAALAPEFITSGSDSLTGEAL